MATPPDYNRIGAAFNIVDLLQQLVDGQQELQNSFQEVQEGQREISRRIIVLENDSIRSRNHQNLQPDPTAAVLLPLRNVTTGEPIPDCPISQDQIKRLTQAEANRILSALQLPLPAGINQKRDAVLQALT
ncbi:hypothetical protein F4821DRAFT_6314 [Hypoxylon rubiginosum]|uniref:Uncharacterized protein n=1 Tax=Hypoxylon rubiginosum TaxID=110542 RepID=A0ACC0DP66_9PEZI|nr:hypothetical protein F4821DRAFT_6314 [Hypoxylon rubiginosum]